MNKNRLPSRVNWLAFWRHRWLVLNILNQIAYGKEKEAVALVNAYGGCDLVGRELYRASRDIIDTGGK